MNIYNKEAASNRQLFIFSCCASRSKSRGKWPDALLLSSFYCCNVTSSFFILFFFLFSLVRCVKSVCARVTVEFFISPDPLFPLLNCWNGVRRQLNNNIRKMFNFSFFSIWAKSASVIIINGRLHPWPRENNYHVKTFERRFRFPTSYCSGAAASHTVR